MPIKQAGFKHLRQTKKRTLKNRAEKNRVRSLLKKTRKAVDRGDAAAAQALLKDSIKALDKAAQHGVLKKNTAARTKSRLVRRLAGPSGAPKG